ncbi:uncharacterized protein LOC100888975 isoform X2 [Strongylocentrotus purpuratus]|uniref:Uncharacterized protein n=1 Tax=Strongylocentrotus purpuratus TaxID=7668 RepID=A0A7M7HF28_STRPU|nr:uncharacterized protein LOC100888975 isoform X2 [Strongylocentrotus purpuratus]
MGSTGDESTPLIPICEATRKGVNVVVCSCSRPDNVEGIMLLINANMADVVKTVRFQALPYNIRDMDAFNFSGIDVLLLCHSIENRRFSLTNVTDALYDGFLPKARMYLGKSKVGVIAHDFPDDALLSDEMASKMEIFRGTQERTFANSSLVLIGGQLTRTPVGLTNDQINKIKWFFHEASSPTIGECLRVCLHSCFTCCC